MLFTPTLSADRDLVTAPDYTAWSKAAHEHDRKSGLQAWRDADESKHFDYKAIRARLEKLRKLSAAGDVKGLLFVLNEGIHGNIDGMGHERLYQKARFGTEKLIEDYVAEVVASLEKIATARSIGREEKRDFFRRAQHCYGRSALLLSGSGSFLLPYRRREGLVGRRRAARDHVGRERRVDRRRGRLHAQERRHRRLPRKRAPRQSRPQPRSKRLAPDEVRERLADLIPDLTFQEAYEVSGRHLNVSVAPAEKHQNGRLLNAITAPNVLIREAVLASCAVPGVFPPVMLMARDDKGERIPYQPDRRWVDGSVTHDIPTKRLERLYGVNHHIVSQANPIALPFATDTRKQMAPIEAIQHASMTTFKAWLNANMVIFQKPLELIPPLNSLANMARSVINQEYTGDINIIRPPKFWSPTKILSDLGQEDIDELIDTGERTAWPKVEMVRTQTAISRALEAILAKIDKAGDDGPGHRSAALKKAVR